MRNNNQANLWVRYWKTHSVEDRNAIVEQFLPYVKSICHRRLATLSKVVFGDIYGAGCEGLIKAVEKYNDQKASFKTYASLRINGCILDYLRFIDIKSREIRRFDKKRERTFQLLKSFDEAPSEQEICAHMKWSWKKYSNFLQQSRIYDIAPFPHSAEDDFEYIIEDDSAIDPAEATCQHMSHEEIMSAISPNEQVLFLMYSQGYSFKEISRELGISETRLFQIKAGTIHLLRWLERNGLRAA